jgi:hypothetical protein
MEIDGRRNPDRECSYHGAEAEAECAYDTGQNPPLGHRISGCLRQECPVNSPPPICDEKIDDDKQSQAVDNRSAPKNEKRETLEKTPLPVKMTVLAQWLILRALGNPSRGTLLGFKPPI